MSRRTEKTGNHRRVWPEPIKAKAIEMAKEIFQTGSARVAEA